MALEQLLNKLIEKGWKPRGEEAYKPRKRNSKYITYVDNYRVWYYILFENLQIQREYTKRELVSKESGLWQFVCENGMIPRDERVSWRKIDEDGNYINHYAKYREKGSDVEYRIIESALCDEYKLENFILENIKIDE